MFRITLTALCLLVSPAFACENPYEAVARAPVPAQAEQEHLAAVEACLTVIRKLVPEAEQDQFLVDLFGFAVRLGDQVVSARLLDEGIEATTPISGDQTPIALAAMQGQTEIVRLLLAAGARPENPDAPVSPLALAIQDRYADVARLLWQAGGTIRFHPNLPEGTPLMETARYGVRPGGATFELLIEMGEDPNQKYSDGTWPIHVAAALGESDVIRALVAGGANLFARDRQDHTPLVTAAGSTNGLGALPALIDHGATAIDEAIREADLNSKPANAAWLRAIGNPEDQEAILNQAMLDWARSFRADHLSKLILAGADPNIATGADHLINVLGCAPRPGLKLLDHGMDPDLALIDGQVPDWVADCTYPAEEYIAALGWLE